MRILLPARSLLNGLRLVCLSLLVGTGLAAAVPSGELIDRVWAGHPVSFALLSEHGHHFIVSNP